MGNIEHRTSNFERAPDRVNIRSLDRFSGKIQGRDMLSEPPVIDEYREVSRRISITRLALIFPCAVFGGFLCVVLPPYLMGKIQYEYPAPLFPWLRAAIENLQFTPSMLALLLFGFVLGFFSNRWWWLSGMLTVSLFPIAAFLEMIADPKSHNLWPLEFIMYAFVGSAAVAGSLFGRRIYFWVNC